MSRAAKLPDVVLRRVRNQGDAGEAWLAGLDALVADLERAWRIEVGAPMAGGTAALVAPARTAEGGDAVLKISVPGENVGAATVLVAAGGRGYARVLAHDAAHDALLLERLGAPLASLARPPADERAIICDVLREAWMPAPAGLTLMTGAGKAQSLARFILDTHASVPVGCTPATLACVARYGDRRAERFALENSVIAHGDCHSYNLLAVPGAAPERFKFVDPEGLVIERAYDLGILMREWPEELLAGDPAALGRARAAELARRGDVDEEAVWEWGFLERVATGIVLVQIGWKDEGVACVAIANAWAARA